MHARATFSKGERLVSQRLMEQLFAGGSGKSLVAYPLRAVYMLAERPEGSASAQVLISVPKRLFKHAVDRNHVKRQVREAYRRHKETATQAVPSDRQLLIAFLWLANAHQTTAAVESRVRNLLRRIATKLDE